MEKNKVSILLVVNNDSGSINETIKSVLSQSYENFELLIMVDGPYSKTWNQLKKLNDKHIILYKNNEKIGTPRSLNTLIKKSKGNFISFIESGNVWEPYKLEKQINFLNINEKIGASFSKVKLIDKNAKGKDWHINELYFTDRISNNYELLDKLVSFGNIISFSTATIKRSFIKNMYFDVSYNHCYDYDFWLKLCVKCNIFISGESLVTQNLEKDNVNNIRNFNEKDNNKANNETSFILCDFIDKMDNDLFKTIFIDPINKSEISPCIYMCEKFILLVSLRTKEQHLKLPALLYLFKHKDNEKFIKELKTTYNFNISKFIDIPITDWEVQKYKETNKVLRRMVNQYEKSLSWRLTKPFRRNSNMLIRKKQ